MTGASLTKTADLFGVARSTAWKVMTAIEKEGKPPHRSKTLEENEGRITRIQLPKITAELNDHLENPVSAKTIRMELHKAEFHGWAAMRKSY